MSGPVLELRGVRRHFASDGWFRRDPAPVRAVDGLDLALHPSETVGLVGESGCGKTTAGRLALRLERPDEGEVLWRGEEVGSLNESGLRPRRRAVQAVFQDPYASLNPKLTVREVIEEPLRHLTDERPAARRARVDELLDAVGLRASDGGRRPHAFSGGQRQRIAIARALAVSPAAVVCDEAVSALDVSIQAQIANLLIRLQERHGLSLLFISHDLEVVRHLCDRVMVMYLGRCVEEAPAEALFAAPAHPYTVALLRSAPVADPRLRHPREPLQGQVPSPRTRHRGCPFRTRCPRARALCAEAPPRLAPLGEARSVACHFPDEPSGPCPHRSRLQTGSTPETETLPEVQEPPT